MKFLSLHQPNGKELKLRPELVIALQSVDAEGPNGAKANITLITTPHMQLACKESIEQIEAMLAEDFVP